MSTRLETKPGVVVDHDASLPIGARNCRAVSSVSSVVWWPRITSTTGFIGTGFMKCMPMTRSGRLVTEPMRVIGMAGGVGGEHGALGTDGVDLRVDLFLDVPVLGHVLDHEVGRGEGAEVGGEGDAPEDRVRALGFSRLRALLEHALETNRLADLLPRMVEDRVGDVHQDDLVAGLRQVLSDADTHHAGADDADNFDLHGLLPS